MANEVTLADHALASVNEGKEIQAEIAYWLLEESYINQILPWATNPALSLQITSVKTLPTVGTRKINASFSTTKATFEQKVEGKYIFGNEIKVDTVLVDANPKERQIHREAFAKSMAYNFNDMFINGDPASDQFKGLLLRVTDVYNDGFTNQYIDAGSTAASNRGFLYDSTERQYFMDKIAELIDVIIGHSPSALIMNSKMYLGVEAALRREQVLRQDKDMFGRIINIYQDVPLVRIGVKADQTTQIITNTETVSGGTEETSVYAVRFGEGMHLWGIQQKPMEVDDLGRLQSSPHYADRVQWVVGLAVSNPRSIARAYGFVPDAGAS